MSCEFLYIITLYMKNRERFTMWSTWVWQVVPIFFVIIPLLMLYLAPEAKYFCIFSLIIAFISMFSSEANVMFKLHNIYIKNQKIIIKRSFSAKPQIEIPFENASRVEYQQLAQQIVGKFWYIAPGTDKKEFVFFWPTIAEAKWETSKLYQICVAAYYKRQKNIV